jgi:hypothetical protein
MTADAQETFRRELIQRLAEDPEWTAALSGLFRAIGHFHKINTKAGHREIARQLEEIRRSSPSGDASQEAGAA